MAGIGFRLDRIMRSGRLGAASAFGYGMVLAAGISALALGGLVFFGILRLDIRLGAGALLVLSLFAHLSYALTSFLTPSPPKKYTTVFSASCAPAAPTEASAAMAAIETCLARLQKHFFPKPRHAAELFFSGPEDRCKRRNIALCHGSARRIGCKIAPARGCRLLLANHTPRRASLGSPDRNARPARQGLSGDEPHPTCLSVACPPVNFRPFLLRSLLPATQQQR